MQINIKKNYTVFIAMLMLFGLSTPVSAVDTLNLPSESITGKFEAVAGGLVIIKENGTKKSYVKNQNLINEYADYIVYRKTPFSKETEGTTCEVLFVDTFNVKVKTPVSGIIEIPRYRITDLEINIK